MELTVKRAPPFCLRVEIVRHSEQELLAGSIEIQNSVSIWSGARAFARSLSGCSGSRLSM